MHMISPEASIKHKDIKKIKNEIIGEVRGKAPFSLQSRYMYRDFCQKISHIATRHIFNECWTKNKLKTTNQMLLGVAIEPLGS